MKFFLLFLFCCFHVVAGAQRTIDVDKEDQYAIAALYYTVGGEPVSLVKYVKVVEGSAYYSDQWMIGSLIVKGGRKYDSLLLRLDLLANELHYQDSTGRPLIATTNVSEVWLNDLEKNSRIHLIDAGSIPTTPAAPRGWYQVMTNGPVILFKSYHKEVNEVTRYGTALREQTISTQPNYFILAGNRFLPVKKIQEIAGWLPDKKEELEKYIKANRLGSKSEGDFINLVAYYNSSKKE